MGIIDKRSLLVAGVHKGGTTSLYKYLGDHPQVCRPLKKELHFFTPIVYNEEVLNLDRYFDNFKDCKQEQYLMDVSPSYLYGGDKIIHTLAQLNRPKIIVVLRNPTDRFVSFYKQGISSGRIKKSTSLSDFIDQSMKEFESFKATGQQKDTFENRALREGCYSLYLEKWIKQFSSDFKIILFEELVQNQKQVLKDLCVWLGIGYIYDDYNFTKENPSMTPKSQGLSSLANKFFLRFERFFRKNQKFKNFIKHIYDNVNKAEGFSPEIDEIQRIDSFYKNHNETLNGILREQGLTETKW